MFVSSAWRFQVALDAGPLVLSVSLSSCVDPFELIEIYIRRFSSSPYRPSSGTEHLEEAYEDFRDGSLKW